MELEYKIDESEQRQAECPVQDIDLLDMCPKQEISCGYQPCPGKQLFISHPNADPSSRPDCYTRGPKGFGVPHQHPLYGTSNAIYGGHAPPPGLNKKRFPRNSKFTNTLLKCGIYEDFHLTTQVETDPVYRPYADK